MRWIKDRIMDKDNDIETETDSVISSMTDVSIYHEFDQIMAELHSIQQLHHQTIQQCQQLLTESFNQSEKNKKVAAPRATKKTTAVRKTGRGK